MIAAAGNYVSRCRRAGDQRPVEELLRDIVSPALAAELASKLEHLWVI